MHRLTVVILAAVDAAIAVAVGIAAILAPLTLLWVLGFDGAADWAALWPASATIWQFGHAVPVWVTFPGDYIAATGIDVAAASFVLSLPPLAFATFTAIFAARSGVRASRAEAWITGVITGTVVVAALAALAALTSSTAVAATETWQAVLLPTLVYALPAAGGAIVTEWSEAGSGRVAQLRDRVEASRTWGPVPALVTRGSALAVAGLVGLGALLVAVAVVLGADEMIALFEAGHVDALGATVITLAQLAYLPTAVVWGLAFVAGPGFALGAGTAVSPAGTQVGVVPGIPILGAVPESTTPWLLLLALAPVAVGVLAGWIARSRLAALEADADPAPAAETEAMWPRLAITGGIVAVSAGAAALLAWLASGALGPGRLAETGPQPGPVALAVGLEIGVGAGILLLSPRRRADADDDEAGRALRADRGPADDRQASDDQETAPLPPMPSLRHGGPPGDADARE
ncbi:DUF6350 family protein [Microbacter sp. GSS18]|nr:DUF6350 family protein [Microbacter sp. GSS18]